MLIHDSVLVLTATLMVVVAAFFVFTAFSAGKLMEDYAPVQKKFLGIRAVLFWSALVAGVAITALTTLDLPYGATRGQLTDGAVEIDVEGRQWFWQLSSSEAKAGDTVVFRVRSGDVNHGLGVYDPDMRLVGQTQAMPGYVNSLQIKLERPGTYKLLCLEYCGLAHHAMISQFTVAPR